MVDRLRYSLMQWLLVLTPIIIMIFTAMVGYSIAQQNKVIDSKASKSKLDDVCKVVEKKVDNSTLLEMIKALSLKDVYLERMDEIQTIRINKQEAIQQEQLKVLQQIEIEITKLNNGKSCGGD